MWIKARCLAALEGELPDAYTVDVRVQAAAAAAGAASAFVLRDGGAFAVHDARSGKPHLSGTISAP